MFDPLVGVGDRPAQRGDAILVVTAGVGVHRGGGGVEQGAAVGTEDVLRQEVLALVVRCRLPDRQGKTRFYHEHPASEAQVRPSPIL